MRAASLVSNKTTFLFLWLLQLKNFILFADGKVSSGRVSLTGEAPLFLLTKFAVSAHEEGSFHLTLTIPTEKGMYVDERGLKVSIFNEERGSWLKARKESLCRDKMNHAKKSIGVEFNVETRKDKKGTETQYWVSTIKTDLISYELDMYWYILLDDCTLEQVYHSANDAPEMEFEYIVKNGQMHHSSDELGMDKIHLIQIVSSASLMLWMFIKIRQAVTSSQKQVHVAMLTLSYALLCDLLSCISEILHSSIYRSNGIGSYSLDCLASHFEAQCDAVVSLILIMIGAGWTLPNDVVVTSAQNMSMLGMHEWVCKTVSGFSKPKLGDPAAFFLVITVLISHAALAQWGRTYDSDFDTYHSLEHLPGRVLMWSRFVTGLIFLFVSSSVKNSGRCPQALRQFYRKFQMVGCGWFVALPFVSTYTSVMMHPHQKHITLAAGSALVQGGSLASLVWLFTADRGASPYHRMSNLHELNPLNISVATGGMGSMRILKLGKAKICLD